MFVQLLLLAITAAPDVSARGLRELTTNGEVLLLPRHQRQPFDAWLYTHSRESCAAIAAGMIDVENYPQRFPNVESVTATRSEGTVSYAMELTVTLSPTIRGSVTQTGPRTLRYNDAETKAFSIYELSDDDDGSCAVRYQIVEEAGKSSGWVSIMKSLEKTAGDAGNYAAALSSARGFAKPELRPVVKRTRAADDALSILAGRGTVITVNRRGPKPTYTLRRRITTPFSDVAWAIRNKKGYAEKTPVVKASSDGGKTASYTIGGFGGRVSFQTIVTDEVDANGTLTVDEAVSGGDLTADNGGWHWRVEPVDGGVDVELAFEADFVAGSRLLSTMAESDPIARESFMLHVALAFMSDLVGGKSLPQSATTIAREGLR